MTLSSTLPVFSIIIPYQELLGNYDRLPQLQRPFPIIPYQELLGNYDVDEGVDTIVTIIPYQGLLGNYDALFFWQ